MKRWQDSGVVEDSEEEDLDLFDDNHSQDVSRKRQKVAHHDEGSSHDAGACATNSSGNELYGFDRASGQRDPFESTHVAAPRKHAQANLVPRLRTLLNETDGDEWLDQTKVITYGKRGKSSRPGSSASNKSSRSRPSSRTSSPGRNLVTVTATSTSVLGSPQKSASINDGTSASAGALQRTPLLGPEQVSPELRSPSMAANAFPDIETLLPPNSAVRDGDDDDSSGLSSPPSECAMSPRPMLHFVGFDSDVVTRPRSLPPSSAQGQHGTYAEPHKGTRRSLRAREERQLHPYLYEKAQYQQQWRARGLKPVHYHMADKPLPQTQDDSFSDYDSQPLPNPESFNSSPPLSDGPAGDEATGLPNSGDELPSVDKILRHKAQSDGHDRKRRKLGHLGRLPAVKGDRSRVLQKTLTPEPDDAVFVVPLSPLNTDKDGAARLNARPGHARFRLPGELTSPPLPTSQVSSALRATQTAPKVPTGKQSRPLTSPRQGSRNSVQIIESSDAASATESEDSEVERRRIRREQRRMRGVLPASWLKIDLQARKETRPQSLSPVEDSPASREHSPTRTGPIKGVAQKTFSTRRPKPTVHNRLDLSQSDGSDGSNTEELRDLRPTRLDKNRDDLALAVLPDFDDERMEMDWIDPMFTGSSARRKHVSGQKKKKHQPHITEAFKKQSNSRANFSEEQRGTKHGRVSRPTATEAQGNRKKASKTSRRTLPRLSILDVRRSPASTEARPQFVKLAERAARHRGDEGRHSPSQKVIRLATKADTRDAQETLTAWRAGSIAPRAPRARNNNVQQSSTSYEVIDLERGNRPLQDITNIPSHRTMQQQKQSTSIPGALSRKQPTHRPSEAKQRPSNGTEHHGTTSASSKQVPRRRAHYHEAQLEALEEAFDLEHRAAAFRRRVHTLTEAAALRGQDPQPVRAPQLDRYLEADVALSDPAASKVPNNLSKGAADPASKLPSRVRKRQSHRIDTESREYRQPFEPIPSQNIDEGTDPGVTPTISGPVLQGLGRFGTRYATDFDVRPLPLGTFFRQDTLVGSGDFAASLQICNRDLTLSAGHIRIHIDDNIVDAGPWTEDTASAIAKIPKVISATLNIVTPEQSPTVTATVKANIDHMLRSTVRYLSKCIYFLDPVDNLACIATLTRFVQDLLEACNSDAKVEAAGNEHQLCLQYGLVIANQLAQFCAADGVPHETRQEAQSLRDTCAARLVNKMTPSFFSDLRSFHESITQTWRREEGIAIQDTAVTSVVLLHFCLSDSMTGPPRIWDILNHSMQVDIARIHTVAALDKVWYDIFTVLPILEIDETGVARIGSRFHRAQDNWTHVRKLVERVLVLYPSSKNAGSTTLNEYIRAVLTRCHHLASRWGWWKAEPVLGTIYDFFTSRGLALLQLEQSKGVPYFLTVLENKPSLEVEFGDSSFVIFLKLLATTLQNLAKHDVYTTKKIGGIAYRFIPNHGRVHKKESEIRRIDLDALRNHFDLLCTLYYAIPCGYRPGIHLLRNLVELSTSHWEVCRYSVIAWSSLLAFQSSSDEPEDALLSLTEWGQDMLQSHLTQFKLAKTEAEQDFAEARSNGNLQVTEAEMDATITGNQLHIVKTMVDNLIGIKHALQAARGIHTATTLLSRIPFWDLFIPFDPTQRRLAPALEAALEVSNAALDTRRRLSAPIRSQHTNEESQEYGDASVLEAFVASDVLQPERERDIVSILHGPLSHLVSNVFGADHAVEDDLLSKIIDTWVRVASLSVESGTRSWMNYVGDYTGDAWFQLRETAQRRKFTSYFLSRVVRVSEELSQELSGSILTAWLVSLFDREAALKYQHTLTSSLLNASLDDPLLHNLPFTKNATAGNYDISLRDFRSRRLSLISTILANMHRTLDDTMRQQPNALPELRNVYREMLQKVMQSMKVNYLDLQTPHDKIANPSIQGAYVEFVQEVVTYLQQYTTNICRVDPFFTDSSAFPLPVKDPAYVVGRLRSYVPKLSESKTRKQLAVFIHTLCERAAVERQQDYLVDQLCMAVQGTLERGSIAAPSLRHVLLTAIFPAYIEPALNTKTSWILALPILRASRQILADLQYNIKMNNESSIRAGTETLAAVLSSLIVPVRHAVTQFEQLQGSPTLRVLALVYENIVACLTIHQILAATEVSVTPSVEAQVHALYNAAQHVLAPGNQDNPIEYQTERTSVDSWADTRTFAKKQAADADSQHWAERDGSYFVRLRNTSNEVEISLASEEVERSNMKDALTRFCRCYEMIHEGGRRRATPVDAMFAEMMI